MPKISSFYLSYDGLTDPLGQSQVLPYIIGLRSKGVKMTVFSFEKKERAANVNTIKDICKQHDIEWIPLTYTKKPPILSTIFDIIQLKKAIKREISKNGMPNIVHCRGYITAMAGLWLKKKFGVGFVFDMRGFFADERVDGGLWDLNNPVYKKVYQYFKAKEYQFFSQSDAIISLTNAGKNIITKMPKASCFPEITVIPCCADLKHFNRDNTSETEMERLRKELNISDSDFILSYLGSLGTWYLPDEMMDFFAILLTHRPNARFLWITPDSPEAIYTLASKKGIDKNRLIIKYAQRQELPNILTLSHISIFFIKPAFSKQASSPTKMGELMGLGIPLICNSGVGDVDEIVNQTQTGALIAEFNESSYHQCCEKIDNLMSIDKKQIVDGAFQYYSLETGVERYFSIYQKIRG